VAFVLVVDGKRRHIGPRGVRIGRGPGDQAALADGRVSRHHARVWIQGAQVYVEGLDSTNGAFFK
jgi:pSer/pThr/pTyr-binding forkhead associated (FHA) protein